MTCHLKEKAYPKVSLRRMLDPTVLENPICDSEGGIREIEKQPYDEQCEAFPLKCKYSCFDFASATR